MKELLNVADDFMKKCNWKTMGLMKFCLISLGAMLGMCLPEKAKKPFFIVCLIVFISTYIPLMIKLLDTFRQKYR